MRDVSLHVAAHVGVTACVCSLSSPVRTTTCTTYAGDETVRSINTSTYVHTP